ncbi:MAG: sigma-70 family RNA polymerase sigma factor [Pirellulaceae bacterium]
MISSTDADSLLVDRIRRGEEGAWDDLIARYEGRLLAFVESRLGRRGPSEDIVQESFLGFLNSLPNYDGRRPLESYLFSICAYKLTDHLRREGRRPAVPLSAASDTSGDWQVWGSARQASSIARSGERKQLEEKAIAEALTEQFDRWRDKGEWTKLMCAELLFVRGWPNKEVAERLSLTEQQVANYKFDFIARLRTLIQRQDLNEEVFPELYEETN